MYFTSSGWILCLFVMTSFFFFILHFFVHFLWTNVCFYSGVGLWAVMWHKDRSLGKLPVRRCHLAALWSVNPWSLLCSGVTVLSPMPPPFPHPSRVFLPEEHFAASVWQSPHCVTVVVHCVTVILHRITVPVSEPVTDFLLPSLPIPHLTPIFLPPPLHLYHLSSLALSRLSPVSSPLSPCVSLRVKLHPCALQSALMDLLAQTPADWWWK